ncbi:MAG: TonB-dependent receptor [Pseudomonadota bacterium]
MSIGSKLVFSASAFALLGAGVAVSQESDDSDRTLDRVVVTGSFIQGTPEDAALPVDVLSAEDLKLQGSPQLTDLIRNLGVSSGADGQTNQFTSNGLEGTANINLRGLGAGRTLVLINGKRQTFSPREIGEQAQLFVDTNMIPSAAIKRVEILKDGAAALYGSDAIAGVANFITNDELSGFTASGDYEFIDGSDGNYNLSAAYGLQFDGGSWVTSVGYNTRSELSTTERDWAVLPFSEAPEGGYSTIGNPGSFVAVPNIGPGSAVAGTPLAFANSDDQCETLGGVDAGVLCRFNFTQFDNLIEEEERIQIFSELNFDLGNADLHLEALYGSTEVPEWKTSPSYPPQALFGQVLLPNHPGLVQYIADNPEWAAATYTDFAPLAAGTGAPIPGGLDQATTPLVFFGRTFGNGGFPGTGGAQEGQREANTKRLAADLSGDFESGVTWDLGFTFSEATSKVITNDTSVNALSLALLGLGGPDCANGGGVPGQNGCLYYNPFSNAVQSNAITGAVNPQFNPALANSVELGNWLTEGTGDVNDTRLIVFDAVFSGESSIQLGGGAMSWAAGGQLRHEEFSSDPVDSSDLTLFPCTDPNAALGNDGLCPDGSQSTGLFAFLAGGTPYSNSQNIFGGFVELQLPFSDRLDVQAAVRYEKYPGNIGQTVDPKLAFKFQASDAFAIRGSAQTSFKGPTLNQLDPGLGTTLQFIAPTGAFKAVDQAGDPDLEPESATSFNIGGILQTGNFNASVDYYNFEFSDTIIVESQDAIVDAVLTALADPTAPQGIVNRVTFDGAPSLATIERIRANIVNGPDVNTSGIDARADYTFEDLVGADISLGVEATFVLEYDVGSYQIEDVIVPEFDALGQLNRNNFLRPVPEVKANFFANYNRGIHNLRADIRYLSEYDDQRFENETIDSFTSLDVTYNLDLTDTYGINAFISGQNITDEDPPFARLDLNYDPYTHPSYGRVIKIGASVAFGGN